MWAQQQQQQPMLPWNPALGVPSAAVLGGPVITPDLAAALAVPPPVQAIRGRGRGRAKAPAWVLPGSVGRARKAAAKAKAAFVKAAKAVHRARLDFPPVGAWPKHLTKAPPKAFAKDVGVQIFKGPGVVAPALGSMWSRPTFPLAAVAEEVI